MNFISRRCPGCDMFSWNINIPIIYTRELKNYGPRVNVCSACGFVYLDPIPDVKSYQQFYDLDAQRSCIYSLGLTESVKKYNAKIMNDTNRRLGLLKNELSIDGTRLLDVGAGLSNFASRAQYRNPSIVSSIGLDPSKKRVLMAKEMGYNILFGDVFSLAAEKFAPTLITAFHVLEHVPDPNSFLSRANNLLRAGQKLVIEVPNHNDFLIGLGVYKDFYYQIGHCNYFTPKSLKAMIEVAGFKLVRKKMVQRYSFDNHLYWLIKKRPGRFKCMGLLNGLYDLFVKAIGRYDTIFFVCEKVKTTSEVANV